MSAGTDLRAPAVLADGRTGVLVHAVALGDGRQELLRVDLPAGRVLDRTRLRGQHAFVLPLASGPVLATRDPKEGERCATGAGQLAAREEGVIDCRLTLLEHLASAPPSHPELGERAPGQRSAQRNGYRPRRWGHAGRGGSSL